VLVDGRPAPDTRTFAEHLTPGNHQLQLTAHGATDTITLQALV
jgi:hypothetical protein